MRWWLNLLSLLLLCVQLSFACSYEAYRTINSSESKKVTFIFNEVDKLAAIDMKWPTNYLKSEARIRKVSSDAMAMGLSMVGDKAGRGGYLELLLKRVPTELYPGILHLMQWARIKAEPPISLLHSILCLFRVSNAELTNGSVIVVDLVKNIFLEYMKGEFEYRESFIQNIPNFSEGVLYGEASTPLKKLCVPHELLVFYDERNLKIHNTGDLAYLFVDDLRLRFVKDPEAAGLARYLSSRALYFWRKFRIHSALLIDPYILQQRLLYLAFTPVQVAKKRIELILFNLKDIFTLHPTLSWNRITSILYLLEYIRIVSYIQDPLDEAFMIYVEEAVNVLLQKTGSMLIQWKELKRKVHCEPLEDLYLVSGKTDSIIYKPKMQDYGERLNHAEVHIVPCDLNISQEEALEGSTVLIFIMNNKLTLEFIIHLPKSSCSAEIDTKQLLAPLYKSPGKVIYLDEVCHFICRSLQETNTINKK